MSAGFLEDYAQSDEDENSDSDDAAAESKTAATITIRNCKACCAHSYFHSFSLLDLLSSLCCEGLVKNAHGDEEQHDNDNDSYATWIRATFCYSS